MAATDNMPTAKSYKPSDVIISMNGRSIEVDNTDAEGRVTLADAIEYTKRLGATHMVDLATLTGAVIATCADIGAGLFGNDEAWSARVQAAAASVDEYVWPMPMWAELKDANKTPMADLKNSGASFGGAGSSSAALFLAEFAETTPWVHLDIAGTAFRKRHFQADPDQGTGWGLRTLVALVRSFAK
jgi:leucyl aminopeptidase